MYSLLGLPFLSPTINMFIEDENFIKLVNNLDYYMSVEPSPIVDNYVEPLDSNVHYPKITIGDVEICALHYKNCEEAIDAWNRRRKRVNLENVYVIGNSWNCHQNEELIKQIADCKYPSVVFTYGDFGIPNGIVLRENQWKLDKRGIVRPNITDRKPNSPICYFEELFDFVNWLNS